MASRTRSRRPRSTLPRISSDTPGGVGVGRVDQVDAGLQAEVDLARRARRVGHAHRRARPGVAERHRAERQRRHAQARPSQLPVLHHSASSVRTTLPVTRRCAQVVDRLARLAPVARRRAVHPQAPVGDQPGERGEVGAERLLAGRVDEEADQAPERRRPAEVVEPERRRLTAAREAVGDDRASRAQAVDRVEQHRPPHPVQDRVEAPGVVVEGRHDGVGAERARRLRARVAADQRRDVRAAGDGELHRERAHAAGRARDEDAAAEQVPALPQRAQRGEPGHRQRGRVGERDVARAARRRGGSAPARAAPSRRRRRCPPRACPARGRCRRRRPAPRRPRGPGPAASRRRAARAGSARRG